MCCGLEHARKLSDTPRCEDEAVILRVSLLNSQRQLLSILGILSVFSQRRDPIYNPDSSICSVNSQEDDVKPWDEKWMLIFRTGFAGADIYQRAPSQ